MLSKKQYSNQAVLSQAHTTAIEGCSNPLIERKEKEEKQEDVADDVGEKPRGRHVGY